MIEQQTRNLAKKEICIKNSSVDISPIKKVSAKQVASPKKKASTLPLPKLTIPKKIAKVQKENIPGTMPCKKKIVILVISLIKQLFLSESFEV